MTDKVEYARGGATVEVGIDAKQRAEMFLARRAAQSGKFPTVEEENEARALFGLPPVAEKPEEVKEETKAEEEVKDEAKAEEAPPSLESLCAGIAEAIAKYPKDHYTQVDPKVSAELQALLAELRKLWNGLADEVRAADASVISTLDRYDMTVEHRRPSQEAMYQQQGLAVPKRR